MSAGEAVRWWRDQRGISQEKLSELSGVPRGTIARIEQGRGSPWHSTLERLANGLRLVSVAELLAIPPGDAERPEQVHESESGYEIELATVPFFGAIPDGLVWSEDGPAYAGKYQVVRHTGGREGFVALRISGRAMHPHFLDGDLVLVDTYQHKPRRCSTWNTARQPGTDRVRVAEESTTEGGARGRFAGRLGRGGGE